jgi:uncharacterized membrane-anchored protein YitT (DUF2179 family)
MKKYNIFISYKNLFFSFLLIFVGSVLIALAINMFLDPYKIAPGGLSGVGIVLKHLFHWKIGLVMLILNIPIFIIGIFTVGAKFGWKTIIGTIILSIAIDVTAPFVSRFPIIKDVLLASIYGGVISGVGLAMVFRAGATTGGTDLVAQILHKFFPFVSVGKLLMLCDGCVVIFSTIVFKNYELALYDILTIFITSKIIDTILEGVDFAKAVIIISNESELIADRLMNDLDRGVTGLNAQGMFKRVDKTVLFCVVKRTEVNDVKEITRTIDKNAFVILTDVREVLGEGFKAI